MKILDNIRRWIMQLFRITQKIIPETNKQMNYYQNYIQIWKNWYQGYVEDFHNTTFRNAVGNQIERKINKMNTAKFLCAELASLIFTEKVDISVSDPILDKYVKSIFEKNKFQSNQCNLYEMMFALGGAVNKVYRRDNKTVIDYIVADKFIPIEYDSTNITGAIFANQTIKKDYIYTLIEKHTFANNTITIENKLFRNLKSSNDDQGVEIALSTLYPELEPIITINNVIQPIFSYVKPALANNIDLDTPLGISIFANSLDTLKSLDICFDSLQREFILGKKRIIVPGYAVKTITDIDGKTYRYFDANDDVFQSLNLDETDNYKIEDNTQTLRVDEHIGAINAFLNILCVQSGMSPGFISFDMSSGLKTATEVVSENSKTYRTKRKFENIIEHNIKEVINSIINIGVLYNDIPFKSNYEIIIKFDDSIIEDNTALRARDRQDVTMGIMSKAEYRAKWFGESIEEAQNKINEISSTTNMF